MARDRRGIICRLAAASTAALLVACAQGGGDSDGGTGGFDGRPPPRRDGSGPPPDPCTERGFATTCPMATDIGPLMIGERYESEEGLIAEVGGQQWVRVSFPMETPAVVDGGTPTMVGGGAPAVRFLRNAGDAYRIEIRNECVGVASCGDGTGTGGMATNITEWSFTDTPTAGDEGPGQFSTRDVPWPESIYVRIYPIMDPVDCGTYQIEIVR